MDNKVDEYITNIADWRSGALSELRSIINETAPEFTEEFKWGVPVWTYDGLVCAISAFKDHVKINFFKGVYLPDTSGIFNSGLESKEHRSINFGVDDKINTEIIASLVKKAKIYNTKV